MNTLIQLTLGLAACASVSAFAADANAPLSASGAPHDAFVAQIQKLLPHVRISQPDAASAAVATPKVMGTSTYPGTPMANGFRAYPPSCAADPLPNASSSLYKRVTMPLFVGFTNSGAVVTENATITVWRLACSSSGNPTTYNPTGAFNAMTLLRIDRADDSAPNSPRVPFFQVKQGSIDFTSGGTYNPKSAIRVATEPNTVISEASFDSPIPVSTTYVLENYPYEGAGYFTFSDAFTLRIDPGLGTSAIVDIAMDAYAPTQSDYPDAYNPLPLDGYAAAQWFNSEFNEGLIVQVAEAYDAANPLRRQLGFDLLTEDTNGDPLWLVGNAAFDPKASGVTSLKLDLGYLVNGNTLKPWGTATVQMNSCNELKVTYAPDANLPAPIPSISGATTYGRIFSANGMVCE